MNLLRFTFRELSTTFRLLSNSNRRPNKALDAAAGPSKTGKAATRRRQADHSRNRVEEKHKASEDEDKMFNFAATADGADEGVTMEASYVASTPTNYERDNAVMWAAEDDDGAPISSDSNDGNQKLFSTAELGETPAVMIMKETDADASIVASEEQTEDAQDAREH